jgi:DNA polymerase (family X)
MLRQRSAHYAGGLSVEQTKQQHRQKADRLNKAFGKNFRILKGMELPSGPQQVLPPL